MIVIYILYALCLIPAFFLYKYGVSKFDFHHRIGKFGLFLTIWIITPPFFIYILARETLNLFKR